MTGPVTITMATMPGREAMAARVRADLAGQCDLFLTYDNGAEGVDLGDAGKFAACPDEGFHITVDDDLFYPLDFVVDMLAGVQRYGCPVTMHGRTFEDRPVRSYYHDAHQRYRCLGAVAEDVPVHIPGTCNFAYHTSMLRFSLADFHVGEPAARNMADIWAGLKCQQMGLPIMCLAHPEGYLRHQPMDLTRTIYHQANRKDEYQTRIINENRPWRLLQPVSAQP